MTLPSHSSAPKPSTEGQPCAWTQRARREWPRTGSATGSASWQTAIDRDGNPADAAKRFEQLTPTERTCLQKFLERSPSNYSKKTLADIREKTDTPDNYALFQLALDARLVHLPNAYELSALQERHQHLSPREREAFLMVGRSGMSTKEIADAMGVSTNTATHYRDGMQCRLNLHNRYQVMLALDALERSQNKDQKAR